MILLYIDPGTGSMLFSIVIGITATLYFVAKAVLIKLKFLFSGGKLKNSASAKNSIVIYCEGIQYWNVFEPILSEFETRGVPVVYYTSAQDDPVFSNEYRFITAEYIGEGNKAFARLNLLEADVCLMTTPGLDVYQLKRSKGVKHYSHILHAVDDATSYRLFGLDYFDSVLLSGEYQKSHIRQLETVRNISKKELTVVGCPYLDVLEKKITSLAVPEKNAFTVLIAPSWGTGGLLSKYGSKLLDPLTKTGFHIIIRPHPQSAVSESSVLEKLQQRYNEKPNIEWDFESENLVSLSRADILISDFSGVIFDFVFLFDKPFLYANQNFDLRPYDADDIDEEPWKFQILKKIGIELKENEFSDIKTVLENVSQSTELAVNRREAAETAWQFRGQAGKQTVDFLINTAKRSGLYENR